MGEPGNKTSDGAQYVEVPNGFSGSASQKSLCKIRTQLAEKNVAFFKRDTIANELCLCRNESARPTLYVFQCDRIRSPIGLFG